MPCWRPGGADSLEGLWGVLIRREGDGALTTYRANCYISDILSLSDKTLLVAGHMTSTQSQLQKRRGVILQSSDGGQQWSTVYRGDVSSINALTLADSNTVWAVVSRGVSAPYKRAPDNIILSDCYLHLSSTSYLPPPYGKSDDVHRRRHWCEPSDRDLQFTTRPPDC